MNKNAILAAGVALVVGLGGGYLISMQKQPAQEAPAAAQDSRKPLFYRHPMNPEITSPVPAKDD
ncbi:MAG TPA: efflux transporter periplasmic adaptor subunit, partial [Gammaproteobacteria bacterium]|nr:efflux transporter periplasmic adaptor subunit [Gammaproteobacteria bacterium]